MGRTKPLKLTPTQRGQLECIVRRRTARAGYARRARVVLMSADGVPGVQIATRVGLSVEQVCRIRRRFTEGGVEGLADQPKAGRRDHAVAPELVEQVVQM